MLRNVQGDDLNHRFREWQKRLNNSKCERRKAVDLYSGNAWSVIRGLLNDPKSKAACRIWVLSAGYGLVSCDEELAAYAATFSSREADSVIPTNLAEHSVSEWWTLLVKRRRRLGMEVASISDVAKLYPKQPMVVALSSEYLKAVEQDLLDARSHLKSADHLVVIAAGANKNGELKENYLPCDARFEHRFGRSRLALNARILRSILHKFPANQIHASVLGAHFGRILEKLPISKYPERESSTDETVREFIRRELEKNAKAPYTGLLRLYRSSGRACEMKRFRGLFRKEYVRMKGIRT